MKFITIKLFTLLILVPALAYAPLGKVVITDQPFYEEENIYFPHDYFVANANKETLPKAVTVEKTYNSVFITNTYNDGFTGHRVKFTISKDLNIINASYEDWTDDINGSEVKHTVEKVIFSINSNPFEEEKLTGHYTLQIRSDYSAAEILSEEEVNDTTHYFVFNGKFKVYSDEEIKKGKEWIINKSSQLPVDSLLLKKARYEKMIEEMKDIPDFRHYISTNSDKAVWVCNSLIDENDRMFFNEKDTFILNETHYYKEYKNVQVFTFKDESQCFDVIQSNISYFFVDSTLSGIRQVIWCGNCTPDYQITYYFFDFNGNLMGSVKNDSRNRISFNNPHDQDVGSKEYLVAIDKYEVLKKSRFVECN